MKTTRRGLFGFFTKAAASVGLAHVARAAPPAAEEPEFTFDGPATTDFGSLTEAQKRVWADMVNENLKSSFFRAHGFPD